jgi:hypothetical protein
VLERCNEPSAEFFGGSRRTARTDYGDADFIGRGERPFAKKLLGTVLGLV